MLPEKTTPIHVCTFNQLMPSDWNQYMDVTSSVLALLRILAWADSFQYDIPNLTSNCKELQVDG